MGSLTEFLRLAGGQGVMVNVVNALYKIDTMSWTPPPQT